MWRYHIERALQVTSRVYHGDNTPVVHYNADTTISLTGCLIELLFHQHFNEIVMVRHSLNSLVLRADEMLYFIGMVHQVHSDIFRTGTIGSGSS